MNLLVVQPIGFLRSQRTSRFMTPRQPGQAPAEGCAWVELVPGRHLDHAIHDLEGFSRIWLIWWFQQNRKWRPKVLPPRGRSGRKGVLSTRSPHRPNPLGISAVPLLGVSGHSLMIGEHDLLDGTPILDIKPYLPPFDAFPGESMGWLDKLERGPDYWVSLTPRAQAQMDWLVTHYHADFAERVYSILEADPMPLRSRRIAAMPEGGYRLGCGPWRIFYQIEGQVVRLEHIGTAQPPLDFPA